MANFKECTIYNNGTKVLLNLDMASSITPTNYKDANAIVGYPDSEGEAINYYVRESYEELRVLVLKEASNG